MYTNFSNAPSSTTLHIEKISDLQLESELFRIGLVQNSEIIRMDAEADVHTFRIKTSRGETTLAGGMGGKIVAHLDDGRIIPLIEMRPKETGHIEAIEAGEELTSALKTLGVENGEEIQMLRCLPPMEYIALVENKGRVRLSEGMAAKIIGSMGKKDNCQFTNAGKGLKFNVKEIIGGKNAIKIMQAYNIKPNDVIYLESVKNASTYRMGQGEHFILVTKEGLRLYLKKDQADALTVSYEENLT